VVLTDAQEFGVELGLQDSLLFDRSTVSNGQLVPGYNFNNQALGSSSSAQSLASSQNAAGQALSNFGIGRTNSRLGYGGLVLAASSESISVLIRALQDSRRLEVLGRPQVMTLDNQPAYVQVGQRVPQIIGSAVTFGGNVINSITLQNTGLILGVTPRISPEGTVIMEIDAERSEVNFEDGVPIAYSQGQPIISPSFDLTTAQTTVSAADGETVVLGGLITKNKARSQRRVPWLSDIPLLGLLFRYEAKGEERNELLIILTPHVVRSKADAERLKQVESARMNWCLSDVHAVHGSTGICEHCGKTNCQCSGRVVYPDVNPRGLPAGEFQPREAAPSGLPLTPPAENIPAPPPLTSPAEGAPGVPAAIEQPLGETLGSDERSLMNP
jgi:type II secretory pathway component GspD/PulD (secretin)